MMNFCVNHKKSTLRPEVNSYYRGAKFSPRNPEEKKKYFPEFIHGNYFKILIVYRLIHNGRELARMMPLEDDFIEVEEFQMEDIRDHATEETPEITEKEKIRAMEQEIVLNTARSIRKTQSDLSQKSAPLLSFAGNSERPKVPSLKIPEMKSMVRSLQNC